MTSQLHKYLVQVIENERISKDNIQLLRSTHNGLLEKLQSIRQYNPRIYYAGSYAKGTMINSSFDLDIVIYFPHSINKSVKQIYDYVYNVLKEQKLIVKKLGVALRLPYESDFHIDIVPGKANDDTFEFATLYSNLNDKEMRGSLSVQIDNVKGLRNIIMLMKIWRENFKLTWHKLAMEQFVVNCLEGQTVQNFGVCFQMLLQDIKSNISTIKFFDPANSNNPIEVKIDEREMIRNAANISFNAIKNENYKQAIGY